MNIGDLYKIVSSVCEKEQEYWKNKFIASMKIEDTCFSTLSFETIIMAIYMQNYLNKGIQNAIAYGAGNMAKENIRKIQKYIGISELWDAYTMQNSLYDIPIVKPRDNGVDLSITIIVFVDNESIRKNIISELGKKGYYNIYYFRDFMRIMSAIPYAEKISDSISDDTENLFAEFISEYKIINCKYKQVIYSVIPKKLHTKKLDMITSYDDSITLTKELFNNLILKNRIFDDVHYIVQRFLNSDLRNSFSFAHSFELFLRELLLGCVKTKERPMRMSGDTEYDNFAVYAAIKITLKYLFKNNSKEILSLIEMLVDISSVSLPLMATKCYFLTKCNRFIEALELARGGMKKAPNDLFASEVFYQTALICKENNIKVSEPLPEYDLSERFCWSGLNFVWCGGFDRTTNSPKFGPCFRPLQCAARPDGEFWNGDDWKEFRKSVTDGSFKYCQKNECPNIVGGWLPKKNACNEEWLKQLLDGDLSLSPPIEEIHLSYDENCNLKCPSCRLEFRANTTEENEKLNKLYDKHLRPLMRSARHLTLSGCGEAIISPHSKRILQSFSSEETPNLAVELRTNVTLTNNKTWESLGEGRKFIQHITVSIDSASKELFEELRFPAKWEVVLKNLDFIRSLRKSNKIRMFEFHVVVQEKNVEELIDILKMAIEYEADAITFSKIVNWRGMSEEEYGAINPFWIDNPKNAKLIKTIKEIEEIRDNIEKNTCELTKNKKKLYINMHFSPDPSNRYGEIRMGRLKIR